MIQVLTLDDLADAANGKRAIVVPSSEKWSTPRPASVAIRLQGCLIRDLLRDGMFIYEPGPKSPPPFRKERSQ